MKYLICKKCGKIIEVLDDKNTPTICCGEPMEEIICNTVEASLEKHIPVYDIINNVITVKVGEVEHPMMENHYIKWIIVKTDNGVYRKELNYKDKPIASFALLKDEKVTEIFAYCNLHGLWMNKIN